MKRETKVGITVAGVFLAMAGGALGIRMWKGQQETPPAPTSNDVAQQPQAATSTENNPANVTPPPGAIVNNPPAPTFPPVVATPTALTQSPLSTPMEPSMPAPMPVVPAPVVPETKTPEPTFPPVVETPKQPEVQPPPPINNDPPKPIDPAPTPIMPPVVEQKKEESAPPPAFPPVVETKPEVPVTPPPVTPPPPANPEPVAKIEQPQRPDGGSPAPLPDAIKTVQPTGIVAKPTRPATDSYMEEEYKSRAGDNFAAVSKKFYYHEKYSQALQQYNRDYPLASANLKADPPRFNAGQVVWIPPIRILEKRYPTLIPDFKPVPGQTTSAASPATTNDSPTWTTAANNNTPPPPPNNGPKTYRVRDGGETMHEIARRTLGNTLSWQEIYRLNPSLNPSATTPIPAGTLLRLPANAKDN